MAGFTDFLFNGQTPPSVTSTSNQGGSLPLWYSSYLSTLTNQASQIAGAPYQAYGAPRIAGLDQQENQAYDYMGQNANNWQAPMQQAQQAAGTVAGGFNQDQFNKTLSPYTTGVVDEIGRLGMRRYNEELAPALDSKFMGLGQTGSQRHMDMSERLARDTNADITGQQGMALHGAFNTAMQNYNTGMANTNAGAQNLGGLAQAEQGLTTGTAGALSASGATRRGFDQSNLDLAYQDFQNQLNYPRQNVNFMSSVLHGQNVPTSQDSISTAPASSVGPSPLSTFAGLMLAGTGMEKKARGGYIRDYKRGGHVRRYAKGGYVRPRGGLELVAVA